MLQQNHCFRIQIYKSVIYIDKDYIFCSILISKSNLHFTKMKSRLLPFTYRLLLSFYNQRKLAKVRTVLIEQQPRISHYDYTALISRQSHSLTVISTISSPFRRCTDHEPNYLTKDAFHQSGLQSLCVSMESVASQVC